MMSSAAPSRRKSAGDSSPSRSRSPETKETEESTGKSPKSRKSPDIGSDKAKAATDDLTELVSPTDLDIASKTMEEESAKETGEEDKIFKLTGLTLAALQSEIDEIPPNLTGKTFDKLMVFR